MMSIAEECVFHKISFKKVLLDKELHGGVRFLFDTFGNLFSYNKLTYQGFVSQILIELFII